MRRRSGDRCARGSCWYLSLHQLGAATMATELDPGAAGRLREALDVLAGGELPECPVCKPLRATARN